jgi:hypothetical protein
VALNQEQNGGMEPDQLPEGTPVQTSSVDESRRRFAKAGVAASGVLLTLASRPVLATGGSWGGGGYTPGTKTCKSCSAWMSANMSKHANESVTCTGKSPKWWKNCSQSEWTKCSVKSDDLFPKHFSCGINASSYNFKMIDVCDNPYSSSMPLADLCSRLVAALLNCRSGKTSFLTEATVKAIFNEITTKTHFSPTAGVNWDIAKCIEYLTATQSDV